MDGRYTQRTVPNINKSAALKSIRKKALAPNGGISGDLGSKYEANSLAIIM